MSPAIGPAPDSEATCDHGDVTFGIDPDPVYLRHCDQEVAFYAPIETVAGPIGLCPYHLARYLEDADDRLEAELVERSARDHAADGFVTIDGAPPLFITENEEGVARVWSRVAIDQRGRAHYQRPEDEEALVLDANFEEDFAEFGDGGFPGYMESIRTSIGFAAFDEDLAIPTGAADPEDTFRSDDVAVQDDEAELLTDGGRRRFWITRVHHGPIVSDANDALRCDLCGEDHPDDPFANHADDCPVSEEWVKEQRKRVEQLPGVGPTGADRLLREYGSADQLLAELCRADPGPHAGPLRIVRLNGFGVDSARKLVEAAHRVGICDQIDEGAPELLTDGGTTIRGSDRSGPEPGADPWCDWCDADLEDLDHVWLVERHDGGRWPPAFCSKECASKWGNAATQGKEYRADRSVIAGVGDSYATDGGTDPRELSDDDPRVHDVGGLRFFHPNRGEDLLTDGGVVDLRELPEGVRAALYGVRELEGDDTILVDPNNLAKHLQDDPNGATRLHLRNNVLPDLEDRGLLYGEKVPKKGQRDPRWYSVTDAGQASLDAHVKRLAAKIGLSIEEPHSVRRADLDAEPIDMGGWQTISERDDRSNDRVVDEPFCIRCGSVHAGEGLCESCENDVEDELVADGGREPTIVDAGDRVGIGLEVGDAHASIILPKDAGPRDVVRTLDQLEKITRNELAFRQRTGDVDEDPEDTFRVVLEDDQDDEDPDDGTKYGPQGVGTEVLTDGGHDLARSDRERLPRSRHWSHVPKDTLRQCTGCGVVFDAYNHDCPFCSQDTDRDRADLRADGGRDPVSVDHLLTVCEVVQEGDEVELETASYDYAAPLEVADIKVVEWQGAGWRTARLVLEGVRGGEHKIVGVEGDDEVRDFVGETPLRVYQLDPVDVELPDDPDDDPKSPLAPDDSPHKYTTNGALDDLERRADDEEEGLDPLEDGERRPWSELGVTPPADLSRADLEVAVEKSDRLYDVCQELGLRPTDRGMVRVLLVNEGLYRDLHMPEARRRTADAEGELATDGGVDLSLIEREDVRLRTTDEGPALEIGDTEILLRTFITLQNEESRVGHNTIEPTPGIDCDGDNGCWFELVPDGDERIPWVTIQPEIRHPEENDDEELRADGGEIVDPAGPGSEEPDDIFRDDDRERPEESFRNLDVATSEDIFSPEQRELSPAHRLEEIVRQARILREELDLLQGDAPELAGITAATLRIAERHGFELDRDRIAGRGGDPRA